MKKRISILFTRRGIVNLLVLLVTVGLVYSCGSVKMQPINYGNITTEGVQIRAVDGSFNLSDNGTWTPPFQCDGKLDDVVDVGNNVTRSYEHALKLGAQKVRVKTPFLDQELYGVLALNGAAEECKSPVTRSYQIAVPEEYVQQALNGQVSVLFEYYNCHKVNIKSWILWLSDVPF